MSEDAKFPVADVERSLFKNENKFLSAVDGGPAVPDQSHLPDTIFVQSSRSSLFHMYLDGTLIPF